VIRLRVHARPGDLPSVGATVDATVSAVGVAFTREGSVFRSASRTVRRSALALMLLATASCGRKDPSQMTYDADGVAQNVLALIPYNTRWARTKHADAVLYRIELRTTSASGTVPTDALYSFYSPSSRTFMTATSDPKIPWAGAEPQAWPVDRPAPPPLPTVTLDFAAAWKQAKEAKVEQVTAGVLEVNTHNPMMLTAWSFVGRMPNFEQHGVFFNAITGQRINELALFDIPSSDMLVQNALSEYRGALRNDTTDTAVGCTKPAVRVPAVQSVVCYDVQARTYSALTAK
jgi:hypothetical protein